MSSALAIAAVTACLKDRLNNGLIDHDLSVIGSFSVTAQPPDRVTTGQTESNQLNLFLYQVTPNSGWRNVGLPARDARGTRISNPPLALDLHYLLTAYGASDLNAEVLLGYAMQLIHDNPVLTRRELRTALAPVSPIDGSILPGPFGTLSAADLADQVELIKLTPLYLSTEDLSKLWTAMQSRYRPSMAYMASVILIQSEASIQSAPPVLKRGPDDRGVTAQGAPAPVLTSVRPAGALQLPAARLGDDLSVSGNNLATTDAKLVLENARLDVRRELNLSAGAGAAGSVTAHLPSVAEDSTAPSSWAIGVYTAAIRVAVAGRPAWLTNSVPLALAPSITVTPLTAPAGSFTLTVQCVPRLRPEQEMQALLFFGDTSLKPDSVSSGGPANAPTTLTFALSGIGAGAYLVRLRVDGIDSLPVTSTGTPPSLSFDPNQMVTVT